MVHYAGQPYYLRHPRTHLNVGTRVKPVHDDVADNAAVKFLLLEGGGLRRGCDRMWVG